MSGFRKELPPREGSLAALYLGCLFEALFLDSGLSKADLSQRLALPLLPTASGYNLPAPETLRANDVCAALETLAPRLMPCAGLGDVLRSYQEKGVLDPELFEPLVLGILRQTARQKFASPAALAQERSGQVFALFCALAPKALPKTPYRKPAPPLPQPKSLVELLGQELCLQESAWEHGTPHQRKAMLKKTTDALCAHNAEQLGHLWAQCAERVSRHLTGTQPLLPRAALQEALDGQKANPDKDKPPYEGLYRRAAALLRFQPL